MFYIIIFSLLAVLLIVAGLTVLSRRRTQLHAAESQASGHAGATERGPPEAQDRTGPVPPRSPQAALRPDPARPSRQRPAMTSRVSRRACLAVSGPT